VWFESFVLTELRLKYNVTRKLGLKKKRCYSLGEAEDVWAGVW
jgi:hypothetical protein